MSYRNKNNLLLSPIFLVCLSLLLLNDNFLKQHFSNNITGKLSDVVGLVVFPVFIAFLMPLSRKWICAFTAVSFLFWKTPLVTPLIDLLNHILPITIHRTVDYSDYWALVVLPFVYRWLNTDMGSKGTSIQGLFAKAKRVGIAVVSLFAICASAVPRYWYEVPSGTVYIGKKYVIKKSKKEILDVIKSLGYNADYYEPEVGLDTNSVGSGSYFKVLYVIPYYQTDNVVLQTPNVSIAGDTILHLRYTLNEVNDNKTVLEIANITFSKSENIQKWQTLRHFSKMYNKLLKEHFIEEIE